MPDVQELNPRQAEAVLTADGHCVLVAGPGTGKTRTIAQRIAHLIMEKGVLAQGILAVTFTRGAAREMRERLKALLPEMAAGELWIDTFHAAALRMLREHGYPFGPEVEFSIAGEQEKQNALEGLVPRKERASFLEEIRKTKQSLLMPATQVGIDYQQRLLARRLLDFDDLFIYCCRLFDERPQARELYRQRLNYILVDEFQDTSSAQYHLLRELAGANVCAVGDPDQAIYGFAGESFKAFEEFKKDFPSHRCLALTENYRSKAVIVSAAQQVIARNRPQLPRELKARLEGGLPIEISSYQSDRQEAEIIVRKIESLLGGASHFTIDSAWAEKEDESLVYGLNDIAILYRVHAQARRIEEALERAGLPFQTFGKKPKKKDEAVSLSEELEDFKRAEFGPEREAISLMTLHRAKGLEFPVVFLAGCEAGLLPFLDADLEEERRLFYVGMTRAKSRLLISRCKKRLLWGKTREGGPSPFLADIEEELRILKESLGPAKKKPAKAEQPTLFSLGER